MSVVHEYIFTKNSYVVMLFFFNQIQEPPSRSYECSSPCRSDKYVCLTPLFNYYIMAAFSILVKGITVTPESPGGGKGNGPETWPADEWKEMCIQIPLP